MSVLSTFKTTIQHSAKQKIKLTLYIIIIYTIWRELFQMLVNNFNS